MSDTLKIIQELRKPFAPDDLEHRIAQSGKNDSGKVWAKYLTYVTARAIHERLDAVVPGRWQCTQRFVQLNSGTTGLLACICGLSIKLDGEWILREDGADPTDVEAVKGAFSSSMKRAAVLWGLGRDLYKLEECWAMVVDSKPTSRPDDWYYAQTKEKVKFWWKPNPMPDWYMVMCGKPAAPAPVIPKESPAPSNAVVQSAAIVDAFFKLGIAQDALEKHLGGVLRADWTASHIDQLREFYKIKRGEGKA